MDVTLPDSETTRLIKKFKDFQLKSDATNFREFKSFLSALYVSQNSSMKKEVYRLAEKLKCFPKIEDTNFHFEDRKNLSKEEKLQLLMELPSFNEEWEAKINEIIEQISTAIAESMLLIDTIWSASEKMSMALEAVPVTQSVERPLAIMKREPTKEDMKLLFYEYQRGKSPSEIVDSHPELNIVTSGLSKDLALTAKNMINEQELQINDVKSLPNWGTIKRELKIGESPLSSQD